MGPEIVRDLGSLVTELERLFSILNKDSGRLKLKTVGIYASMKVTTKQDEADPDFQFLKDN